MLNTRLRFVAGLVAVPVSLGAVGGAFGDAPADPLPIPWGATIYPYAMFPTGFETYDIATGDFNGDGIIDVATVNAGEDSMSILLGAGDHAFARRVNYPTGDDPRAIRAGDLNGDGALDLVYLNFQSGSASVVMGLGDGTFGTRVDYPIGSQPSGLVVVDLNGDGVLDLAVVSELPESVRVAFGTGSGAFGALTIYGSQVLLESLTSGDFDGDGDIDLAVTAGDGIRVLRNDGAGAMSESVVSYGLVLGKSLTAGDFDGDGDLDLAAVHASPTYKGFATARNNGDGTFQGEISHGVGNRVRTLRSADFDQDGDLDLIATSFDGDSEPRLSRISVRLNSGAGAFPDLVAMGGGTGVAITPADLDGDGALDLAFSADYALSVAWNLGGGRYEARQPLTTAIQLPQTTESELADMNGDGLVDVVYATYQMLIAFGMSDGSFGEPIMGSPISSTTIDLGDIDGDGDIDVFSGRGSNSLETAEVLVNDGSGALSVLSTIQYPGAAAIVVRLGDMDGDGSLDLVRVTRKFAGLPLEATIGIRFNLGGGQFSVESVYKAGLEIADFRLADMDLDGDLDFVGLDFIGNSLVQLTNAGDGTLENPRFPYAGALPFGLEVGLLDDDAFPDVVLTSTVGNHMRVLLNDGTGEMIDPVQYIAGFAPGQPSIGDVDLDGLNDIVTSNRLSASVFLNRGDGRFRPRTDSCLGWYAVRAYLLDLDGDSDLDILGANSLSIIPNQVRRPRTLCPADVDGDAFVTTDDFVVLAGHFGAEVPAGTLGDLNGDGLVNAADFVILAAGFGCGP